MRKTIDLNQSDVDLVNKHQGKNGLKNFSEAMRNMIRGHNEKSDENFHDDNFALLADAILKMDEKINLILESLEKFAPNSPGEV